MSRRRRRRIMMVIVIDTRDSQNFLHKNERGGWQSEPTIEKEGMICQTEEGKEVSFGQFTGNKNESSITFWSGEETETETTDRKEEGIKEGGGESPSHGHRVRVQLGRNLSLPYTHLIGGSEGTEDIHPPWLWFICCLRPIEILSIVSCLPLL